MVSARLGGIKWFVFLGIALGEVFFQRIHLMFWDEYRAAAATFAVKNEAHCLLRQDFLDSVNKKELVSSQSYSDDCLMSKEMKNYSSNTLAQELRFLVAGYPLEAMIPFISEQNLQTAAFLVGIAKKESDWGKHVPTKDGMDCYNYWGYKGVGSQGSSMGYSCFSTPREAVETVGNRLSRLVAEGRNTPPRMIVWKCGSSCDGHSKESVQSWIGTVGNYYRKIIDHSR